MGFSKILIVGYGSSGKKHHKILSSLCPKADIRILRNQKSNSYKQSKKNFYKLVDAISFNPQLSVIANPASLHIYYAIELAKIGCHLFIEKPISNNLKNIKYLIKLRDRYNLFIQIGYNLRFVQSLIYFKKQIETKKIGKLYSVRCEAGKFLPSWRPKQDYSKSVSANKSLGGGVLLELSHEIDYLSWIFGEVSSISGLIYKHSNLKIDTEDSVYLNLETKKNKTKDPLHISLNLDFIRQDNTRVCLVIGEKGTLKWDGIDNTVSILKTGSKKWKKIYSQKLNLKESYLNEWQSFFINFKSKKKPEITIEEAMITLKTIQFAIKSNKLNGKMIRDMQS